MAVLNEHCDGYFVSYFFSLSFILYLFGSVCWISLSFFYHQNRIAAIFLISLLGWSFMKSPSNCVDSSATESEEYSESETEDYLKGLGEEQRVCIIGDWQCVRNIVGFSYPLIVEARSRTIKRSSKAVQNIQRKPA